MTVPRMFALETTTSSRVISKFAAKSIVFASLPGKSNFLPLLRLILSTCAVTTVFTTRFLNLSKTESTLSKACVTIVPSCAKRISCFPTVQRFPAATVLVTLLSKVCCRLAAWTFATRILAGRITVFFVPFTTHAPRKPYLSMPNRVCTISKIPANYTIATLVLVTECRSSSVAKKTIMTMTL